MSEPEYQLIECQVDQDVIVVTIQEEEVMGEEKAIALKADLQQAARQFDKKLMVIDFQHVRFMTSRPFGALSGFRKEFLQKPNSQIALCGLSVSLRGALSALHFVANTARPINAHQEPPRHVMAKPAMGPLFVIVTDTVKKAIAALNLTTPT